MNGGQDSPNLRPSLYFLFTKGDLDGPNYHFVVIDQYWDRFASIDWDWDCPNFNFVEIEKNWD
jgi:hypothetical protein